jgi:hypothetical protein
MTDSIAARIKTLQSMSILELKRKYQELYGKEISIANKGYLIKKIAWRIQEIEYGGLTKQVKKRALEISQTMNLPGKPSPDKPIPAKKKKRATKVRNDIKNRRLPMPGTLLTREYKGRLIRVEILEDGLFEHEGCKYRSLSAVAKAVTGSHWNGYLFFNVR